MKVYRFLILLFLLLPVSFPAAAEKRSESWDSLIEIAYKFTWYPRKDLQELLRVKADEYEQSLEEYQNILIAELSDGTAVERLINPELFITPKPWKLYYRLAIAEFCSFLALDDEIYLENAISALSVISGRKEMANVSFWYFLLQSYNDLIKKDRNSFVRSVFQLWKNGVMQSEINQMMTKSNIYEKEFTIDLDYFYENTAHLIVTKAIIENHLPDLHPLAGIVISLQDNLILDNGYKRFVEAIVERLQGLKSDNNNLNFAVAFVEATASQYEFEDEKSKQLDADKYNAARLSYDLTLSWANTRKGKAAVLTQYMGFNNYIVRRLLEKDTLLTSSSVFLDVPREASQLADTSIALYDQLTTVSKKQNGFLQDGFHKRGNYIEGMHQLWDSFAKLLMTLSTYHKTIQQTGKTEETSIAEALLLKYLSIFHRYTRVEIEMVPDNAFFTAAYAAGQLSNLYMEAERYSTSMKHNNLAFAYQLQAVELFPLDILGILKLAYQTDQENRPRMYFQYVAPLALRLRDSQVARSWLDKNPEDYKNSITITLNVVPNIVENAFLYINALQQVEGSQIEEDLYNKLLIMNGVVTALKIQNLEEQIPSALTYVAKKEFPDNDMSLNGFIDESLPADIRDTVLSMPELKTKFFINRIKNELYASPDIKIHTFLRELYYEYPVESHGYLSLLKRNWK
ncbi:MAG: hypothetical protein JSU83_07745 [Deltaproteobacteria bacterium]|nr:MAG: hypothetical protein JSU83_07745 [Deltaproteobacteria bacterium]